LLGIEYGLGCLNYQETLSKSENVIPGLPEAEPGIQQDIKNLLDSG
jgi:hypothetical protein